MSRDFYDSTPKGEDDYETQVASGFVRPVFFVEAFFGGSTFERLCTNSSDITIGSKTYSGAGDFLSFDSVEETYELRTSGTTVTLSGLDSSILSHALNSDYQNKGLTIRLGLLGKEGNLIYGDTLLVSGEEPPIIFKGRMEVMTITDTGDSCSISVSVQNRLSDFERDNESRYTYEEHLSRNPGDMSLEHVQTIQNRVLEWGA